MIKLLYSLKYIFAICEVILFIKRICWNYPPPPDTHTHTYHANHNCNLNVFSPFRLYDFNKFLELNTNEHVGDYKYEYIIVNFWIR